MFQSTRVIWEFPPLGNWEKLETSMVLQLSEEKGLKALR